MTVAPAIALIVVATAWSLYFAFTSSSDWYPRLKRWYANQTGRALFAKAIGAFAATAAIVAIAVVCGPLLRMGDRMGDGAIGSLVRFAMSIALYLALVLGARWIYRHIVLTLKPDRDVRSG